ncbi:SDR family NAD(P)-dependent oxidoreductase [Paenibacillus filicis]|uniref:SDR family NAD(P)-dependent oxidoreductase n=1 Tax=Paenibacillus filicis TaxID=669464 RepID=A0ABU9DI24_9BACL
MNVYIITGTTRGLGAALAAGWLREGALVVGLARTYDGTLGRLAEQNGARFEWIACDLAETGRLTEKLEEALERIPLEQADRLTLVHNAGVLEPMGPLEVASASDLALHTSVNLTAPLVLTSAFIRLTEPYRHTVERTIVAVSSGAARKPYAGWSAYCATKAGLDMLARCIAVEQGDAPGAVRFLSIAPGVIDTRMQEQIRATADEAFPAKARFVKLQASGQLLSPDEAAGKLIRFIGSRSWKQGDVLDLRDLPLDGT